MKLFKDEETHRALVKDMGALTSISDQLVTRMGSRVIDNLIENIDEMIWENLTEEVGKIVFDTMNRNPDSQIVDIVDFLEFKESVVIQPASWLDTELGLDVPDTVHSVAVYKGALYIEILKDGRYHLTIENQDWITPNTSLLEMEIELYGFYQLTQN